MSKEWDQFPAATPIDVALHAEGVTGKAADVARSIYQQESSSGKNTKTSNAGAVGGMQVLPGTFKQVADKDWDINDPIQNARAGVRYVNSMYERSGGDAALTAAGYYGGPGGQDKAKNGIAVADPRNPNAPTTLEYGQQVASRVPTSAPDKSKPVDTWDAFPQVDVAKEQQKAQSAPTPPQRSMLEDLGRQLGLTARAGVSGVASIPAMVADGLIVGPVNLAMSAYDKATGSKEKSFRLKPQGQVLNDVMTSAGVPTPENAQERVVQDVASSMAGTGGMVKAGQALASRGSSLAKGVGEVLAAGPKLQVASAATGATASGVTRESGGGEGAQLATGLVGSLAPALAPAASTAALRGALRGGEAGRKRLANNIATFEAAGVQPTLGQAAGGKLQRMEALVAKAPGGAGVVAEFANKQADDMAASVQRLSDQLAPGANAMQAGEAISTGIKSFKQGFKAVQQKLYSNLDEHLPMDTSIAVPKTQGALKALNEDIAGAPALSKWFKNARIQGIDNALQSDLGQASKSTLMGQKEAVLPYEAIKKLRTLVGNEIADGGLVSDVPRSKWQALYGALSEDLGVAASNAGPKAEQAWKWANTYTKTQLERLDQLSGIVAKDAPEKVFNAAISGTVEGDTIIKRVINALPKQERREVAAAVLQRMGRATGGQQNAMGDAFSSETFLSNLSKLSPASRKTIFGRTDVKGIEDQIGNFAKVAEMRREGGKIFANPSGTATTGAQLVNASALGAGFAQSVATGNPLPLVAAGMPMVGANFVAKALTNPKNAQRLAAKTVLPDGTSAVGVGAAGRALTTPSASEDPSAPESFEGMPAVDQPGRLDLNGMAIPDASPEPGAVAPPDDGGMPPQTDEQAPLDMPQGETVQSEPVQRQEAYEQVGALPMRKDGTMLLQGDGKELRDTLVAAGIPARSLMLTKGGIVVGKTQVATVHQAIKSMLEQNAQVEVAAAGENQTSEPGALESEQNQQPALAEPAQADTETIANVQDQTPTAGLGNETTAPAIQADAPMASNAAEAEGLPGAGNPAGLQPAGLDGQVAMQQPMEPGIDLPTEAAPATPPPPVDPLQAARARIQKLQDSGETEVAGMLQKSFDREQARVRAPAELAAMRDTAPDLPHHQAPEFASSYARLRSAGAKPAEAAARAGLLAGVTMQAQAMGMSEKAAAALNQKLGELPLDAAPGFAQRFVAGLVKRGLMPDSQGVDQVGAMLEQYRDGAMHGAIGSLYS